MTLQEAIRSGNKFKRFGADDFFWIHVNEDGFVKYVADFLVNENPFPTVNHITDDYVTEQE